MSEPLFKIHAPSVDTEAILKKIEDKTKNARADEVAELEKIQKLNFQPQSAADSYGFDPAGTCELFERPVEIPDFQSRKYRFMIGPVRYIATRIYGWLSQIFHRSAKNMIQSFYAIVHEQIYVRHRLSVLESLARTRLEDSPQASARLGLSLDVLPGPTPRHAGALEQFLDALEMTRGESLLLLEDPFACLLPLLQAFAPKEIRTHTSIAAIYDLLQAEDGVRVSFGDSSSALLELPDDSLDRILIADLANANFEPGLFATVLPRKLREGGCLAVLYLDFLEEFGFQKQTRWKVERDSFLEACKKHGFRCIRSESIRGFSDASFLAVLQKGT